MTAILESRLWKLSEPNSRFDGPTHIYRLGFCVTCGVVTRECPIINLGGVGSGNFGHAGRPGEVGGSSSEGGGGATGVLDRPAAGQGDAGGRKLLLAPTAPPKAVPLTVMFGGSFNPPHAGHVQAVTDAVRMLEDAGYTVGKVIVAPTADKLLSKKLGDKMYPLQERTELAKRTFTDPRIEVSSGPGQEAEAETGKLRRTQLADWGAKRNAGTNVVNVTGEDAAPGSPPGFPSLYEGDPGTSHEGYHYLAVPRDEGGTSSSKIRAALKEGTKVPDMTPEAESYLRDMLEKHPHIKLSFDLGGEGSGNYGHAGRKGEVGGSAKSGGVPRDASGALDVPAWEKLSYDERDALDNDLTRADRNRWIDERNKETLAKQAIQAARLKAPLSADEKDTIAAHLATLSKADSYASTRFILPDGTRVAGSGRSGNEYGVDEHYDIAAAAGVDIWDAKEAGVIRFVQKARGDVGGEVGGPISHAQAQHLLDAALYEPGSRVFVDVVPVRSKVGKLAPQVGDTKQFDPERTTASGLQRWVNGHYDDSIPWPTKLTSLTGGQRFAIALNDLVEESWVHLGGVGSGNFGHKGRPGEVGGSSSEGGGGDSGAGTHVNTAAADHGAAMLEEKSPPLSAEQKGKLDTYLDEEVTKLMGSDRSAADKADLKILQQTAKDYPSRNTPPTTLRERIDGTLHLHTDPNKEPDEYGLALTPERQALHDAIVRQLLNKVTPVEHPVAVVLGGGPASGKSSMMKEHNPVTNAVSVDPDAIRLLFPEYRDVAHGDNPKQAAVFTHEEASALAKRIAKEAGPQHNVIIDGTGDNETHKMLKKIEGYRKQGQPVIGRYSTSDTETAIARAEERAKTPPYRAVPETTLRSTHAGVSRVLPELLEKDAFDQVELWDTEGKPAVRVMSKTKGGKTVIHDQQAWDRFVAKGK